MRPTDVSPLRVAVIIASTREGRAGDRVGRWFAELARRRADVAVEVVDLAGYDFPARYPARATTPMIAFAEEIGRADAFVVVTPEYNHSFPAPLKQAIDYAYDEWHAKPAGIVSYGCGSHGLRAADQLRAVFAALHVVTVRDGVGFDVLGCGAAGTPGEDLHTRAAATLLDQLCWWGLALREARAARPYRS